MATRICYIYVDDEIKQQFSADYGVGIVPLNNAIGYLVSWASGSDKYVICAIDTEPETPTRDFTVTAYYSNEAKEHTFFIAAVWDKRTNSFSFN